MTPHDDKEQHPSDRTPILDHKHYDQPTVFTAENLLREWLLSTVLWWELMCYVPW